MALPTLDATFASSADLPRKQMLAKWLVEELGETQAPSSVLVSGAGSEIINGTYTKREDRNSKSAYVLFGKEDNGYSDSVFWVGSEWIITNSFDDVLYVSSDDVEFPWLVTSWDLTNGESPAPTVTESLAPSPISNYYSLPERYLWAKIAVAAGGPKTEADYISLPKNYVWSDIYNAISGDIAQSTIVVSGAGSSEVNGTYTYRGEFNGRPYYNLQGYPDDSFLYAIYWDSASWNIIADDETLYQALDQDVAYPWLAASWDVSGGIGPSPVISAQTPNHTDWTENVALGHIAATYRGDTGNPANLATYIDWPWRYKVASIIQAL